LPPSYARLNITADPSGIAWYDEAVFIQRCTGRVAGIRPLSGCMPWLAFGKLTDGPQGDLRVRSVARIRHRVNNTDPATWCPRCGQTTAWAN
jgi:hypothetical protein